MAEYLIQEETLIEFADLLREKFIDLDVATMSVSDRVSPLNFTIPDSVTSIRQYAFYHWDGLQSVVIPDSVTDIKSHAFAQCTNLTDVIGDFKIGAGMFAGCRSLVNISISNKNMSIPSSTFWSCSSLKQIILPSTIRGIDTSAFSGCTSLTDIYLHNTSQVVNLFHTNAFANTSCLFHVPIGLGDSYKSATNWSTYADRIVEDIVTTSEG